MSLFIVGRATVIAKVAVVNFQKCLKSQKPLRWDQLTSFTCTKCHNYLGLFWSFQSEFGWVLHLYLSEFHSIGPEKGTKTRHIFGIGNKCICLLAPLKFLFGTQRPRRRPPSRPSWIGYSGAKTRHILVSDLLAPSPFTYFVPQEIVNLTGRLDWPYQMRCTCICHSWDA